MQAQGCRPSLLVPDPVLSVLLAKTREGQTIASTSSDSCLILGAVSKGSHSAGPRDPAFLHQRGVYGLQMMSCVGRERLATVRTPAVGQAFALNLTKPSSGVPVHHRGYPEPGVPPTSCTQDGDGLPCS